MRISNSSKTSDVLGRYYTHNSVGKLLVESIQATNPKIILDLGAGDGALTSAAAEIWQDANYFTVDIDKKAGSVNLALRNTKTLKHLVADALGSRIEKKLGLDLGTADIALCNPPYIRPHWQANFGAILEDAGLSHVLPRMSDVTAEVLFIAQNLRFLRNDGRLGLIVPDGLIAGERFSKIRDVLATSHTVERVIELPRRIFKKTDAKAHIVILNKSIQGQNLIRVQRLEPNGMLSAELVVPREEAKFRLDYSYLNSRCSSQKTFELSIRENCTLLKRGYISSSMRKEVGYPVLHTSDIGSDSKYVDSKFLLPSNSTELP